MGSVIRKNSSDIIINNPDKDVTILGSCIKSSHLPLFQRIPSKTMSEKIKHPTEIIDQSRAQKDTMEILSAPKTTSPTSLEVKKFLQKHERHLDTMQRYFVNCYVKSADGEKLKARLRHWSELLEGFFQNLSGQSQIPVCEIIWIVDIIKKCLSTADVDKKSKILLVEWTLKAFNSILSPEQAPYFYLILTYLRVLDPDDIYPEIARKIAKVLPLLITFFSLEFLELIVQTLSEVLDLLYPGSKNVILNILVCLVKYNNEMIDNFSASSSGKRSLITRLDDESYEKIFTILCRTHSLIRTKK